MKHKRIQSNGKSLQTVFFSKPAHFSGCAPMTACLGRNDGLPRPQLPRQASKAQLKLNHATAPPPFGEG